VGLFVVNVCTKFHISSLNSSSSSLVTAIKPNSKETFWMACHTVFYIHPPPPKENKSITILHCRNLSMCCSTSQVLSAVLLLTVGKLKCRTVGWKPMASCSNFVNVSQLVHKLGWREAQTP
jgi:hypothetical protein